MHKFTKALAAIGLAAVMSQSAMAENLKLGFLVKQPEEPWFQTEWKFADKAGKDLGFEVIKIAVPDGEKTLNAIDSLAASGAKGFVICTPDPKLGSAIVAKARGYDMKVIAVDDQFVNAKGKPMDTVPLVMMAATKIGERQGQELYKEMQKRGWDVKESAVMAITANELDTARRRTTGSMDALKAAGFPEKQIYQVPTKSNDIPGAFDAANSMLVQHPEVKHWLIVGMNDSTVLGGVRATEGQGFKAADIIGIGINGVDAVSELSKAQATGFYGSLLPSPDVHGYKSSEMLYNWVAKDVEPPKFTEVTDVVLITRDNFKEELEKKLFDGGFEVEERYQVGKDISNVVVGLVEGCEPIPETHLHVCQVNAGEHGTMQICCGADNVRTGGKFPVALPGASVYATAKDHKTIEGVMTIKKGKLRGYESCGMLCSGVELGLTEDLYPGAGYNGLLVLPEDAELGADVKELTGLDDWIFDISLTANRPDCQSILGIAREVSAMLEKPLKMPATDYNETDVEKEGFSVRVEAPELCPRYSAHYVYDVKIGESPAWMKRRLALVGMSAISNVVDITNYVLKEIVQPLTSR